MICVALRRDTSKWARAWARGGASRLRAIAEGSDRILNLDYGCSPTRRFQGKGQNNEEEKAVLEQIAMDTPHQGSCKGRPRAGAGAAWEMMGRERDARGDRG